MLTVYVGDIYLGSLERVFPKKHSFVLGVTEELPLSRGVRDELILKGFPIIMLTPIIRKIHNVFFFHESLLFLPQLHGLCCL